MNDQKTKTRFKVLEAGISIVPYAKGGRITLVKWTKFSHEKDGVAPRLPTKEEVDSWNFKNGAGVCLGPISGNLVALDFDEKHRGKDNHSVYERWISFLSPDMAKKARELTTIKTRNNGFHVLYRTQVFILNSKDAFRVAEKGEVDPNGTIYTAPTKVAIIEVQTQKKVSPIPPTEGYEHFSGTSIDSVITVSNNVHEAFQEAINTINEVQEEPEVPATYKNYETARSKDDKPLTRHYADIPWSELLTPFGIKLSYQNNTYAHWHRQGKTRQDISASTYLNHKGTEQLLHVFSSNMAPFQQAQTYSKVTVALMNRTNRLPPFLAQDYKELMQEVLPPQTTAAPASDVLTELESDDEYILSGGENPIILLIVENVRVAIQRDPRLKDHFRFNDFSHAPESTLDVVNGSWIGLSDTQIRIVMSMIVRTYTWAVKISLKMTESAILSVCDRTRVNPPREYLTSLVWDKVPRLDTWLTSSFSNVPTDEVYKIIGSNWLKGLCKRVMSPGYQFDEVLIFEGQQGLRKSAAFRILGGEFHVELNTSAEGKDFYMLLAANIIAEFPEGAIFTQADTEKIKSIVTITRDQYRAPYDRAIGKYGRGCVFGLTTNKSQYLKDTTGNRRWLPVEVTVICNTDWLTTNRDQLFAEAYYRAITLNEPTHQYPEEELRRLQQDRMESTDYEEAIIEWYIKLTKEKRNSGILLKDLYDAVFVSIDPEGKARNEMSKKSEYDMAFNIKRILRLDKKRIMAESTRTMRWFPSEETKKTFPSLTF